MGGVKKLDGHRAGLPVAPNLKPGDGCIWWIAAMDLGNGFWVWMFIHATPARVLIDSEATRVYISPEFVDRIQQPTFLKKELYCLLLVDRTPTIHNKGWVHHKTRKLGLEIEGHLEYLKFDMTKLASEDMILGLLWLRRANPQIDWSKSSIQLGGRKSTLLDIISQHDSKRTWKIEAMTNKEVQQEAWDHLNSIKVLWSKTSAADTLASPYSIPKEYKEFQKLFKTEPDQEALSKHQSWDHEIRIEDGKTPIKKGIYPLSAEKLDALRKYLEENQQKGFIRES